MSKQNWFRLILILTSLGYGLINVQALDVSGQFNTDLRFGLKDGTLLFNQEYGSLTFEQQVTDNLSALTRLHLRYYNDPAGSRESGAFSTRELGILYAVYPFELILDEAYFTYLNFIFERLDLTVGKQRITWGAADRLNPTDLLNPLDFSDLFDFGKKFPSLAISLIYTFPVLDASWQVVFEPYSQVARFNPLMIDQLVAGADVVYGGVAAGLAGDSSTGWNERVLTPEVNIKNFALGTRLAFSFWGFDVSANYVTRINDIPYISLVQFDVSGFSNLASRAYELAYYREHEFGFDIVKDLGFVLAWTEVAIFFQPEQQMITRLTGLPAPETVTTLISDQPYVKYTVGFDKNFGAGVYLNMQYNHGFFNERGRNGTGAPELALQDYLLARLEWTTLSDKLKFAFTGLANTNLYEAFQAEQFFDYLKNNYGLLGGFEIEFKPVTSLSIKLGVMGMDALIGSSLYLMSERDMAYVKFDYSF